MTLEQVMSNIDRVGTLVTVVLVIQILIGIALAWAHVRITRNEVQLADLLRQAVEKIERDLPKQK